MGNILQISSPKRTAQSNQGWDGFFPYYAGFPETFARSVISSLKLKANSVVLDPWNGSGTTTFAASQLGLRAIGIDLNPVMVVVAKARLLQPSEADSILPIGLEIIDKARKQNTQIAEDDPLYIWFGSKSASNIRALERSIREHLVGNLTVLPNDININRLSCFAAANYAALFSICREYTKHFKSSNPTWLKIPRDCDRRPAITFERLAKDFISSLDRMSKTLSQTLTFTNADTKPSEIILADTTEYELPENSTDLILTSPPYCTRLDYTSATRIELCVFHPLLKQSSEDLSAKMLGTVKTPKNEIVISKSWGPTCNSLLEQVYHHKSKASKSYYYKTHIDYFDKMYKSVSHLAKAMKPKSSFVLVVQDSYYKDVHNDLPKILIEFLSSKNMTLFHREDFRSMRSMSGINRHSKIYNRRPGAVESVLCFKK